MVTVNVDVTREQNICIGRVGENNHVQVVFDVSSWMAEYPSATIGLFCCLPDQCDTYPVANTAHDGNTFTWTVGSADVSYPGRGKCEIVCIDNGTVAKSMIFGTLILEALGGCDHAPQPWEYWQIKFIELKGDAEQAVADAQAASSSAYSDAASAHDDAVAAAGSAAAAATSETNAAESKDAAAGSATAAAGSASDAQASATAAAGSATDAAGSATAAAGSATAAASSETNAAGSATAAEESAQDSEAYAVGKRDGVDVDSTDETYHNNAKYYNEQAQAAKTTAQEAAASAAAAYGTDLLAADYDTETGATAGSYYIYSGDLYLCTADTTGAWDSTKFVQVTVGGQLGELKSAIDLLDGAMFIEIPVSWVPTTSYPGGWRQGTITSNGTPSDSTSVKYIRTHATYRFNQSNIRLNLPNTLSTLVVAEYSSATASSDNLVSRTVYENVTTITLPVNKTHYYMFVAGQTATTDVSAYITPEYTATIRLYELKTYSDANAEDIQALDGRMDTVEEVLTPSSRLQWVGNNTYPAGWRQGYYSTSNGNVSSSSSVKYIRTQNVYNFPESGTKVVFTPPSDLGVSVTVYSSNEVGQSTFVSGTAGATGVPVEFIANPDYYYGFTMSVLPSTDVSAYITQEYVNANLVCITKQGLNHEVDILSNSTKTCYVATDGNDTTGDGTETKPFATIKTALASGFRNILFKDGTYTEKLNLRTIPGGTISFGKANPSGNVIIEPANMLSISSETAVTDYTKVYSVQVTESISANCRYIFQENVPSGLISDSERLASQRGREYRNAITKIVRCASETLSDALDEIEAADEYKWFFDSNNSALYFSRPHAVSADYKIRGAYNIQYFILNANRTHRIIMSGITFKYIALNANNLSSCHIADCKAIGALNAGGFTYDNTVDAEFVNCEVALTGYTESSGDGFNGHSSGNNTNAATTSVRLINCWSHDNNDDGFSDHESTETLIIGGLYEHNGKYGIAPAMGNHCECHDVYARHNSAGFGVTGTASDSGVGTQLEAYNCVSEDNRNHDQYTFDYGYLVRGNANSAVLVNCIAIDNAIGYAIRDNTKMKLIDCKTVDNDTVKSVISGSAQFEIVTSTDVS